MKKLNVLTRMLLLVALLVGSVSAWADPITLFHETFGDNTGSKARDWDNSYSVKSGVAAVYSSITGYTVSNVKQGKNTTGSTKSGLNQSSKGTDAYIIIGPLNVSNYNTLSLTYQWKAASIGETYFTKVEYKTSSGGAFTAVKTYGNTAGATSRGATSFVTADYNLPDAACVSTLYLKITFNTSNTQAIIDEVDLKGIENPVGTVKKPIFSPAAGAVAYGKSVSLSQEDNKTIRYTTDGTDPTKSSPEYTTPFVITGDITIKAIAVDGENTSSVATASYTIKTPDAPSFSKTGEVKAGALITLSQADDEMIIYTTDGTDPSWEPLNGYEYTSAIPVTDGMTIKAIAVDGAENVSSIASANYTIGHGVIIQGRLVTFDFSKSAIWEFPSDYVTSEATYDSDGYAIKFGASDGHKILGSGIIMGKDGATLTLPGFGFKVYKIKVYGQDNSSTKVTMNFYVVDDEVETAVSTEATASTSDHEFVIDPNYQALGKKYIFKVTNDNNAQITKIEVYGMAEAAFTPARYATFSSVNNLDFTGVDGLTAYKATATDENSVTLEEVTGIVPAETGLLLKAENNTSYYIPVSTAAATADVDDNLLQSTATAAHNIAASEVDKAFVFGSLNGNVGFYKAAKGKTIGEGKSYLLLSGTGAKDVEFLSFVFGDEESETTGIKAVVNEQAREGVYDLQGRKVTNPTKGLYIVNGKKVIIK